MSKQKEIWARNLKLPFPLRILNKIGRKLELSSIFIPSLERNHLIKKAIKATKLSDFGDDDFIEPLDILLNEINENHLISTFGRIAFQELILRSLTNRLKIQEYIKNDPDVLNVEINEPLFIIGLPRTGTTLLHNLLGEGSFARAPRLWEMEYPVPPINSVIKDSRISKTKREILMLDLVLPGWSAIHPMKESNADECNPLMHNTFSCMTFTLMGNMPRYTKFLREQNREKVYRYYKNQLQILMANYKNKYLVLKTPAHLMGLEYILKVFPDAKIVHTHRDIQEFAASSLSLHEGSMTMFDPIRSQDSRLSNRDLWLENWAYSINRAIKARKNYKSSKFYDVYFNDLKTHPIETVKKIHEHFDLSFDNQIEENLKTWLKNNTVDKNGTHKYDIQWYELSEEEIQARFLNYVEAYLS